MSQIIDVLVSPTGETRVETHGFTGASCREATRDLEAALGTRTAEQLTSEFYAEAEATEQQSQSS